MELRGASMLVHDFTPGGRVRFHHKDLGFALWVIYFLTSSLTHTARRLFSTVEGEKPFIFIDFHGHFLVKCRHEIEPVCKESRN